jgi:hypothetical protein
MTPQPRNENGLSRRRFLLTSGGVTLAATVGGGALSVLSAGTASAAGAQPWGPNNPLFNAKWGLFLQFLPNPDDSLASWSARVDAFDVNTYAAQAATAGAGYVLLMLQQGPGYTCAPNPSWPSSTRDLPSDLYNALNARGVKLVLYQACDKDQTMVVNALTAYSQRYGTKVSGWYLDSGGGNAAFSGAALSGNPAAQIMFNGAAYAANETIAQFESYDLLYAAHEKYPHGGNMNGEQAGATSYMSQWYGRDGWEPNFQVPQQNQTGPRYTDVQIIKAATEYISAGGIINLDVPVDPANGTIFGAYIPQLNALGAAISQIASRTSPAAINNLVDDQDPGVSYTGSWSVESAQLPLADHSKSAHVSSTPGDTAAYAFYGNAINVISRVWNSMGKADVYLDGQLDATIDLYSAREQYQKVVYSKAGLATGNHTINVQVRSDRNAASTGNVITIDAFEPGSDRIEAESTCLFGGATAQASANASRGMDVGYMTAAGSGLEYTSPAPATSLTLHYSTTSTGGFSLYVNGVKQPNVPVTSTGSWTTYTDVTVPAAIAAGDTVTLQNDTGDVPINIDYLVGRLEAEYGTLLGGARVEPHTGASNGQNVGYMTSVSDGVEFKNVNASTWLQISYAAASAGTFSLYVNGVKNQDVSFPSTGGWNTVAVVTINAAIPAGATVTLQYDAGDVPINVDYIRATPSVRVAGYGTLLGGAQLELHSNASHGINVGYMSNVGDGVSLGNLNASTFLQISYAAASAGTFSVYVNGVKNQAVPFPSTGGWNTFSTVTVNAAIPAGATVTLQHDAGDAPINIDYIAQ